MLYRALLCAEARPRRGRQHDIALQTSNSKSEDLLPANPQPATEGPRTPASCTTRFVACSLFCSPGQRPRRIQGDHPSLPGRLSAGRDPPPTRSLAPSRRHPGRLHNGRRGHHRLGALLHLAGAQAAIRMVAADATDVHGYPLRRLYPLEQVSHRPAHADVLSRGQAHRGCIGNTSSSS